MTTNKLCFALSLLLPFSLEEGLRLTTNAGNMGLHGALLDIYYKRNFVYISMPLCIGTSFYNYGNFGVVILATSLFLYTRTCNKWYPYFSSAYN